MSNPAPPPRHLAGGGGVDGRSQVDFREVLRIREFRAMWSAELLSICGDQLARVALSVLVFTRTGSATRLRARVGVWSAVAAPALLSLCFSNLIEHCR